MIPGHPGNPAAMEDTPICASVERDLDLSVDELTTYVAAGPVPDQAPAASSKQAATPA